MTRVYTEHSTAELGAIASIEIGRTPSRAVQQYWEGEQNWLSISDFDHGDFIVSTKEKIARAAIQQCGIRVHDAGTLVMSFKLTIGKIGILGVPMATNEAIAAIKPLRADRIDLRYLYHCLSSFDFTPFLDRAAKGKTLNKAKLSRLIITFPTDVKKQRRIATILDKADAIRRKREQVLALSDDFLWSVFLKMFGDPSTNTMGHPVKHFETILQIPLRNGISPSSKGKASANVLTLSAITGNRFDADQVKEGKFLEPISTKDAVSRSDFYICRGNGSPDLVGKGYFADRDIPGTAFPDTMIAAKPDPHEVTPAYLEKLWNSPFIRNQIREAARTTNGTFKINQTAAGAIKIPIPPLEDQKKYQVIADQVGRSKVKIAYGADLFPALSQRAFLGEL
jgi:type I restriction enzyme S subunit